MVSLKQIIVAPKATAAAKTAARTKAESLLVQISKGADFAELARSHSQDPGSGRPGRRPRVEPPRRHGQGVRRDDVRAAGRARQPDRRDAFGYHIIKVDRAQPPRSRRATSSSSRSATRPTARRARLEADSVRAAVAKGADFDSLAASTTTRRSSGPSPTCPRDSLPPPTAPR
jgi:hypothetical protein